MADCGVPCRRPCCRRDTDPAPCRRPSFRRRCRYRSASSSELASALPAGPPEHCPQGRARAAYVWPIFDSAWPPPSWSGEPRAAPWARLRALRLHLRLRLERARADIGRLHADRAAVCAFHQAARSRRQVGIRISREESLIGRGRIRSHRRVPRDHDASPLENFAHARTIGLARKQCDESLVGFNRVFPDHDFVCLARRAALQLLLPGVHRPHGLRVAGAAVRPGRRLAWQPAWRHQGRGRTKSHW